MASDILTIVASGVGAIEAPWSPYGETRIIPDNRKGKTSEIFSGYHDPLLFAEPLGHYQIA